MAGQTAGIEPAYAEIGARIRATRKALGIKIDDLAAAVGASRSTIGMIEAGRIRLVSHRLAAIAAALGVTSDSLLAPPKPGRVTLAIDATAAEAIVIGAAAMERNVSASDVVLAMTATVLDLVAIDGVPNDVRKAAEASMSARGDRMS